MTNSWRKNRNKLFLRYFLTTLTTTIALAVMVPLPMVAQGAVSAPQVLLGGNLLLTNAVAAFPSEALESSASSNDAVLPDAPSAVVLRGSVAGFNGFERRPAAEHPVASPLTKYIPDGWAAQPLTARGKLLLGLRDMYSVSSFGAMFFASGYEQLLNSSPNFGTDRGAYGQRVGAAAIRESTQGVFSDALLSPVFHLDPRYYVQGRQTGFAHRVFYAVRRPIVTQNDAGHSAFNSALVLGYAGASALTYTYYPQINRNFSDTAQTFGKSLGGAAVGFLVAEFSDDLLVNLHLKKPR